MFRRCVLLFILILVMLIILTGCIPGDGKHTQNGPVGFFWGVWHGWIAPISLVVGLFRGNIRIYESINTGWWYDFGFYLAIVGTFGGLPFARNKNRRKRDE